MTGSVFLAIVETFLYFALGAFIFRIGWMDERDVRRFSRISIDVLMPFLTFTAVSRGFAVEGVTGTTFWQLPLIGFLILAVGVPAGFLFQPLMRTKTPERLRSFRHLCVANNYLFLPLIVMKNIWGPQTMTYLLIMNIGCTFALWGLSIAVMGAADWKKCVRSALLSSNTIAAFLAVAAAFLDFHLPPLLSNVFSALAGAAVPLILFLIGGSLCQYAKNLFSDFRDVLYYTLCRMILIPIVLILILNLIPLNVWIYRTAFTVALMPGACASVLIVGEHDGDVHYAGQAIVFSTLASIVTLPLFFHFFFN